MNAWPKQCACGREYYPGEWTELPFVGYQQLGDDGRLELRNCVCGSTIAIVVEPTGLTAGLVRDLIDVFRNEARELAGFPPPYVWPPQARHEVSDADKAEAARLDAIADELITRTNQASAGEAA